MPHPRTAWRCACTDADGSPDAERRGHIELAAPVLHPWLLTLRPNPLADLLRLTTGQLCRVARAEHRIAEGTGGAALWARGRALLGGSEDGDHADRWRRWLAARGLTLGQLFVEAIPVRSPEQRRPRARRSTIDERYVAVLEASADLATLEDQDLDASARARAYGRLQRTVSTLWDADCTGTRPRRRTRAFRPARAVSEAVREGIETGAAVELTVIADDRVPFDAGRISPAVAYALHAPLVWRWLEDHGHAASATEAFRLVRDDDALVWRALEAVLARRYLLVLGPSTAIASGGLLLVRPVLGQERGLGLHPTLAQPLGDAPVRVLAACGRAASAEFSGLAARQDPPPLWTDLPARPDSALLGLFRATRSKPEPPGTTFASLADVEAAWSHGALTLDSSVRVRVRDGESSSQRWRRLLTTTGRALLGRSLPAPLPFSRVDQPLTRKALRTLLAEAAQVLPPPQVRTLARDLWTRGCEFIERSGSSFAIDDLPIPARRDELLAQARSDYERTREDYAEGLYTAAELENRWADVWSHAASTLSAEASSMLRTERGRLSAMLESGALGERPSVPMLIGMPGLSVNRDGSIRSRAIEHNLRDGLSPHEYWVHASMRRIEAVNRWSNERDHGGLCRRLVGALQGVRIVEEDCGTANVRRITALTYADEEDLEGYPSRRLRDRILGRTAAEDVRDEHGHVLVEAGRRFDARLAAAVEDRGIHSVAIRWLPGCRSRGGVCRACYGQPPQEPRPTHRADLGLRAALALSYAAAQTRPYRQNFAAPPLSRLHSAHAHVATIAGTVAYEGVIREPADEDASARLGAPWVVRSELAHVRLLDGHGREHARYPVLWSDGLLVDDGQTVDAGTVLSRRGARAIPIVAPLPAGTNATVRLRTAHASDETVDPLTGLWRGPQIDAVHLHTEATPEATVVLKVPTGSAILVKDGATIDSSTVLGHTYIGNNAWSHDRRVGGIAEFARMLDGRLTTLDDNDRWGSGRAVLCRVDGRIAWTTESHVAIAPRSGGPVVWHALHGQLFCGWPGASVRAGDRLTQGQREGTDLLRTQPVLTVAAHIVDELARRIAYQRGTLAEPHLELIARAMLGCDRSAAVETHDAPTLTGISRLGREHPGLLHRVRFNDPAAEWVRAALSDRAEPLTSPAVLLAGLRWTS